MMIRDQKKENCQEFSAENLQEKSQKDTIIVYYLKQREMVNKQCSINVSDESIDFKDLEDNFQTCNTAESFIQDSLNPNEESPLFTIRSRGCFGTLDASQKIQSSNQNQGLAPNKIQQQQIKTPRKAGLFKNETLYKKINSGNNEELIEKLKKNYSIQKYHDSDYIYLKYPLQSEFLVDGQKQKIQENYLQNLEQLQNLETNTLSPSQKKFLSEQNSPKKKKLICSITRYPTNIDAMNCGQLQQTIDNQNVQFFKNIRKECVNNNNNVMNFIAENKNEMNNKINNSNKINCNFLIPPLSQQKINQNFPKQKQSQNNNNSFTIKDKTKIEIIIQDSPRNLNKISRGARAETLFNQTVQNNKNNLFNRKMDTENNSPSKIIDIMKDLQSSQHLYNFKRKKNIIQYNLERKRRIINIQPSQNSEIQNPTINIKYCENNKTVQNFNPQQKNKSFVINTRQIETNYKNNIQQLICNNSEIISSKIENKPIQNNPLICSNINSLTTPSNYNNQIIISSAIIPNSKNNRSNSISQNSNNNNQTNINKFENLNICNGIQLNNLLKIQKKNL